MSAFDIGGRIVIDGEFDATFDRLEMRAEDAERALNEIEMPEVEDAEKTAEQMAVIKEQLEQVVALSDKIRGLRVEVETDEADRQLADLQEGVDALREKLAAGQELTPVETDFLAGAQKAVEGLAGSLGGAAGQAVKTAFNLAEVAKVALGVAAGVATAAGAVFSFVKAQGLMGEALLQTERGFQALTAARGVDADELLGGLEEASRGAVTASELMKQANQVILAEAEEIATKLPQLYDAARASAQLTGKTTAQAFQDITASVLRLDEAGLRAQGIFVNLTEANQAWAAANGRLAETLSLVEKQQIAASAAAAAAVPLIRDLGIEGATAAEKFAMLPTVLDELKGNFAKSVAGTDAFAAFLNLMQDLGQLAGTEADVKETSAALRQLKAELVSLGESGAAEELEKQMAAVEREATQARAWQISPQNILEINQEELDRLRELANRYRDIAIAANPELLKLDAFRIAAANAREAADATSTFDAALTRARENMAGVAALEGQFASAIALAESTIRNLPEMPDITALMDTDELRAWGNAWAALIPDLVEDNRLIQDMAGALDRNRASILTQAAGISDLGQRLEFLASAFLGSSATVDDLVRVLADLSPEALAAIGSVEDLAMAIMLLRSTALGPITLDFAIRGLESAETSIESLAVRVGNWYGEAEGRRFYQTAIADLQEFWAATDKADELGTRTKLERWTTTLNDIVAKTDPALAQVQQSFQSAFDAIGMSASELRGKIESALMEGSTVTAQDMADTLAGTYDDAPLEAARRLDAIAARGFAELTAHPDWAGLLKIPENVLAGSEAELKAWAQGTAALVRNLERPDLIDWDAFAANFQAGLDREAARELTIDVALNELEGRGLLSGSKEERREKVMEALGLDAPKLTFDALFKAEENAGRALEEQVGPITLDAALQLLEGETDKLIEQANAEKVTVGVDPNFTRSMSEVIAEWQAASVVGGESTDAAVGIVPTLTRSMSEVIAEWQAASVVGGESTDAAVDMTSLFRPDEDQDGLMTAGAQAIGYVEAGATTQLTASDIGASVVSAWSASFAGQVPAFETIGTSIGNTVGTAFLKAMETNAGKARQRVAELVAPEVAAILKNQGEGGGSLP